MTSLLQNLPSVFLNWRKVLRIWITFYLTGQGKMWKKPLVEVVNKYLSKKLKNTFLSGKWLGKIISGYKKPLLGLEFNKHSKKNVHEINLFEKLNFSQSQINCLYILPVKKHDNSTSWNKHITLPSDANVPVRFRANERVKFSLQLSIRSCDADGRDL